MLANGEIIEVIARKLKQYRIRKIVVDPVMVAKSGDFLLRRDAQEALVKKLLLLRPSSRPISSRPPSLRLADPFPGGNERGGSTDPPIGIEDGGRQRGPPEGDGNRHFL